ncbi:MAG: CRISPR/Cas system-associated exonuclease Cas4 (RecB family) [Patiriisocius sp.]|jgi:CRISPR/Cas system-associated exonuclease Cas4 (RecB family)
MAYEYKYNPNRSADWNYGGKKWRLSRSKLDFFIECPRCFYLDNKLGTKRPGFPSFNLNIAVDELFKKEFDVHREAKTAHPVMEQYKINAVPFEHVNMHTWRENFEGIEFKHDLGMTVSGAIDDIWMNPDGKLIIVDYKSTSKDGSITELSDSPWDQQYKRQLGVYKWLLEQNGFKVEDTGYLVYANASKDEDGFDGKLVFETTIVPVETDISWIEPTLVKIKDCLEKDHLPAIGEKCEFCPYREACGKKLQKIYKETKVSNAESTPASTIANLKNKYQ